MRRHPDFSIPAPAPWTWLDTFLVGVATVAVSAIFLAFIVLFLLTSPADARWKAQYANTDPQLQAWFSNQHNAQGQWCCDSADGERYYGNYTINKDGSVTLADGHVLPAYMILQGPNPAGSAIWWHLGKHDYCFALGPMM